MYHQSSAMATPAKYEYDIKQGMGIFGKAKELRN